MVTLVSLVGLQCLGVVWGASGLGLASNLFLRELLL